MISDQVQLKTREEFLQISGKRPRFFAGNIVLPPSKSYIHRALFVASLAKGRSTISGLGRGVLSDDARATIRFLKALGTRISEDCSGTITLHGLGGEFHTPKGPINVGGSGTTARFAISLAAIAKNSGYTTIVGDPSLSKRPMKPLLDALAQLGVECYSDNKSSFTLPINVKGGGIKGGRCVIDSSMSSQFISSLVIACTRAKENCTIVISNPARSVSEPYIDATLAVLGRYGFEVKQSSTRGVRGSEKKAKEFWVRAEQVVGGRAFRVPGDMSSAAALIGAALSSGGKLELQGIDSELPQPDSAILGIANTFGARISVAKDRATIDAVRAVQRTKRKTLIFDLKDSPDIVPVVVAIAAGTDHKARIYNVGHLRFKESDRLSTLAKEFTRLGVQIGETRDSISVLREGRKPSVAVKRKPLVLDPQNDHRMLMAFTIAGLSGRFGQFLIKDPSCVNKSYPSFIEDLQAMCRDDYKAKSLSIVSKGEAWPKQDRGGRGAIDE